MKNQYLYVILCALTLQVGICKATKTTVNSLALLTTTFNQANPGDTIVVANGTYNWGAIILNNTKGASTSAFIVVMAQTRSGVIFTGSTYFMFSGNRILIDGFTHIETVKFVDCKLRGEACGIRTD